MGRQYSIRCVTRDFAAILGRKVRRPSIANQESLSLLVSVLYLFARHVLELIVLRFRSDQAKDLEIVVLRHELSVLRRPSIGLS
jgi:hypothetical protein